MENHFEPHFTNDPVSYTHLMYTLAETEFPLYGPIGETVSATPKDYRCV